MKPAGAFYLFPDVSEFLSPDGIRTTAELAQALLDDARVAVTPGEAFDAPGFLRISYATSMEDLEARHRAAPDASSDRSRAARPSRGDRDRPRRCAGRRASARHTSGPTSDSRTTYGTDALKRGACRRRRRSARTHGRSGRRRPRLRRATDSDRAARRRHRLHRRFGSDPRRRRHLARADEPHPRDRRSQPRRGRRSPTSSPATCRTRSRRSACSIRPTRRRCGSR